MKGQCARCLAEQTKGLTDYCCVLCTLAFSGLPMTLTRTAEGTVIIDLSGTAQPPTPKEEL